MLDANLKAQLQAYMEKLVEPIALVANLGEDAKSQELRSLLQDIVSTSDKISFSEAYDSSKRVPSFTIERVDTDIAVAFAGIPMGHEFTSLVLALLQVGGHPIKLEEEVIQQIRDLPGEYEFETFFSLSCQNCPDTVQALNTMSVINPRIIHTAVDGGFIHVVVELRQVMSVLAMYLSGCCFGDGSTRVVVFLLRLDNDSD